jgi:hypothetical protein
MGSSCSGPREWSQKASVLRYPPKF